MDNQQQIKKIKEIIDKTYGKEPTAVLRNRLSAEYQIICNEEVATALVNAGYGDTKQAQLELLLSLQFAVKKVGRRAYAYSKNEIIDEIRGILNEKVKEVCRE